MSHNDTEPSPQNEPIAGMTPHQALLHVSQADNENTEARAAAIAKNRARALQLLAVIDKSQEPPAG